MEFKGLNKLCTYTKHYSPSIIERLYNFTFGTLAPEMYIYLNKDGTPIEYKKDTIVYGESYINGRTMPMYYKANKDTTEKITDTSADWDQVSLITGVGSTNGESIVVADEQPTNGSNKVWYDTISETNIDIPTDL